MHRRTVARPRLYQRLDGLHDTQPHPLPVQVALLDHGVGFHGGFDRGLGAVLLHEDVGGAVDINRNLSPFK